MECSQSVWYDAWPRKSYLGPNHLKQKDWHVLSGDFWLLANCSSLTSLLGSGYYVPSSIPTTMEWTWKEADKPSSGTSMGRMMLAAETQATSSSFHFHTSGSQVLQEYPCFSWTRLKLCFVGSGNDFTWISFNKRFCDCINPLKVFPYSSDSLKYLSLEWS